MIELLLTRGAQMEARDKDGMTPILVGSAAGHVAVVQQLLKNGANPTVKDLSCNEVSPKIFGGRFIESIIGQEPVSIIHYTMPGSCPHQTIL